MPLPAGTRLGPYEIIRLIGAGGMGEVYRAHDRTPGRDVAIKVLPESRDAEPERLMRFGREARMLAALNHPHIRPAVMRLANPVQVTSAGGVEDHPTWSPDTRTLAYGSNETGNWDIWLALSCPSL
jgi:serine/threonine protein kinase